MTNELYQNYPNPFNPETIIQFKIWEREFVSLKIYDITGSQVSVLVNEIKMPGSYNVAFNGGNLSTGTYFIRLLAGQNVYTKKMCLLR